MLGARDVLDGDALVLWGQHCVGELERHCGEINDLNVFPVPDSDTGTNLHSTMRSAMERVARDTGPGASTHAVAVALVGGATNGARGNSGIILSQMLRGLAEFAADGPLTAVALRRALESAAGLARRAVSVPVEGTIVTVLDVAAQAARECADDAIGHVAVAAAEAAATAVRNTTGQLDVLRKAGVVDAGARGLLVLLDGLVAVTTGTPPHRPPFARTAPGVRPARVVEVTAERPAGVGVESGQHYEVMYLIRDTDDDRIATLRTELDRLGDSVVIVDDGSGTWSSHVHCRDAGAVVDAGLAAGRISGVRITCFALEAVRAPHPMSSPADRGILAVVAGDGAAKLFEAEGATVLRCGDGLTATDLLAAIRDMSHREVLVLPNGALPAQELVAVGVAARDGNRDVLLLPSSSTVQGLASLAVHDPSRIAVDDAFAMSEAAAATRWGSLRVAAERALTLVGTCEPGDGLGLVGHEVVVIESQLQTAGLQLVDRVLALGGELVTLLVGADASDDLVAAVIGHIDALHPGVEVVVYTGGQHADLLQLGVE